MRKMSSSLVNSLAKMYDTNPLLCQKSVGRKLSPSESCPAQASQGACPDMALRCVESRMDSLSCQMERLLNMQQTVLTRLDGLSQDLVAVGRDVATMRTEGSAARRGSDALALCRDLRGEVEETSQQVESQGCRLQGAEKLVEGLQQVVSFIGELVKSSPLVELWFREPRGSRKVKDQKAKDDKAKCILRGVNVQKTRKPSCSTDPSSLGEPVLQEQLKKFNLQNVTRSHGNAEAEGVGGVGVLAELILDAAHPPAGGPAEVCSQRGAAKQRGEAGEASEDEASQGKAREHRPELGDKVKNGAEKRSKQSHGGVAESAQVCRPTPDIPRHTCDSLHPEESSEELGDLDTCSKRHITGEDLAKDDLNKSRVEGRRDVEAEEPTAEEFKPEDAQSDEVKTQLKEKGKEGESAAEEYTIDTSPPPAAPFDHRIVTPKPYQIATYYTINREEVIGGGRFGQVHKCVESSSGLTLAAKIIKARSQKEKEVVKNEIQVMNQLNHANLIQLHAAFESRHDIILVMEYVDGGELFDRIIDENYNLTELDTVLFIRQICEGLQYMHQMYILHLDLKPENILCVSRVTNKIKIIDFGLARRYKPREKLRVNFGTPEFLAPEVINYEFVSFPTDMWSLGVISYMLLSGLSPFLGEDDNETLNNILACQWNFEEEEFLDISEEAKDFITRLLVKSKSWRMSAAGSLRHPWLSDPSLHFKLHKKKNKCHSTHAPLPDS